MPGVLSVHYHRDHDRRRALLDEVGRGARGYGIDDWDGACEAAELDLADRFATWSRDPFTGGDYAVSVHRRPSG